MESEKKQAPIALKSIFQGARVCEQKWVCEREASKVIIENPSNEFLMGP